MTVDPAPGEVDMGVSPRLECLFRPLAAAAVLAATAGVSPAQARDPGIGDTGDRLIVLGRTPGEICFERARAGDSSRDALNVCDYALEIDLMAAGRAGTLVNRGVIREARGDQAGALEDYAAALVIDPNLAEAYINTGRVRGTMADWRPAEDALGRAIALLRAPEVVQDPIQMRALFFDRAVAREELGDFAGAYADYQAAAAADPTWDAPRAELARFRVGDGAS
jgi:tetratricopeptide (TPR) repeat protein